MMPHLQPEVVRVRASRQYSKPGKQRGVVLLIALIALVAMTLAGIALVRSIDTGNVIAGNLAFKQAALQISDTGVEAALAALPNIISTSLDADIPGKYFATMRSVDLNGVITNAPTSTVGGSPINWSTAAAVIPAPSPDYDVRYVIDRLCQGPAPVTDIQGQCISDAPLSEGSKKANTPVFSSATAVYYRVTVRVAGPHNSVSMVQAILSD